MSTHPFTCRDEDGTDGRVFRVRSLGGTPLGTVEARLQARGCGHGGWLAYDRDHAPIFGGTCFPHREEAAWAVHLAERAYQDSPAGKQVARAARAALNGTKPFGDDYHRLGHNAGGY